jgi:diguanylate cyclase (GGDEF)-like protein
MTLRRKVAVVIALPAMVLVAFAYLAFLAQQRSAAVLEATQHSYTVQHETDLVLTDLVDAETGTRGYLLTGNRAYLSPYERGAVAVHADLAKLDALTSSNTAESSRVARLQYLITDRLTSLVELQRFAPLTLHTDQGAMTDSMDQGKGVMDTIRSVLADLGTQETTVLEARQAELVRAQHLSFLLGVAGTPGAVLLALGFVFFSAKRLVSRINRIEQNARRLQRGEPLEDPGDDRDEIGGLGRVVVETAAKLSELQKELRRLATIDELTGVANRRGFLAVAEHQLRLAARVGEPAALMYLDLDNLKPVNDTHGHAVGDQMLKEMAEVLISTFRDSDLVARVGGDEFCVLLATPEDPGAMIALGRLREVAARRSIEPGRLYELSFSVGMAEFDPAIPTPIDELLETADRLMYTEKRTKANLRHKLQPQLDPQPVAD